MQKTFLFLGIALISFGCALNKNNADVSEKTYWVNSFKVDCEGVGPMSCLQIQRGEELGKTDWQNFYSNIEGFDYRPGSIYKLKVREIKLDESQVPADASSIKYELIKVLEKHTDERLRIIDIWALEEINGKAIEHSEANKTATLEVDVVNKRVYGSGSCNNFNGTLLNLTGSEIKISQIASTEMFCQNNTTEDRYLKLLETAKTYEIGSNKLRLFDGDKKNVLTFKKVD